MPQQAEDTPIMSRDEALLEDEPLEVDPREQKVSDLEKRLTQQEKTSQDSIALNRLISDPNIRQYLVAMQEGRKIKLVEDTGAPEEKIDVPEGDPETMSNSELVEYTHKKMMAGLSKQLGSLIAPLQQQISQLSQVAQTVQGQTIQEQIEKVSKKYADFENYRADMASLNDRVKGTLSIEELYKAVKGMNGGGRPSSLQSERPTGGNVPSVSPRNIRKSPPVGRQGFRDLLSAALDKADSEG